MARSGSTLLAARRPRLADITVNPHRSRPRHPLGGSGTLPDSGQRGYRLMGSGHRAGARLAGCLPLLSGSIPAPKSPERQNPP